jgi:hypothetical protein
MADPTGGAGLVAPVGSCDFISFINFLSFRAPNPSIITVLGYLDLLTLEINRSERPKHECLQHEPAHLTINRFYFACQVRFLSNFKGDLRDALVLSGMQVFHDLADFAVLDSSRITVTTESHDRLRVSYRLSGKMHDLTVSVRHSVNKHVTGIEDAHAHVFLSISYFGNSLRRNQDFNNYVIQVIFFHDWCNASLGSGNSPGIF